MKSKIVKFSWIISIALLAAAVAMMLNLKDELFAGFESSEEMGAVVDKSFVFQFFLALILPLCGVYVFIISKSKQEKILSQGRLLLLYSTFAYMFNLSLTSAVVVLFVLLDKIQFGIYIFDLYFINLLFFALGVITFFEQIKKLAKKEEDLFKTVDFAFYASLRRGFYLCFPTGILFAIVFAFVGVEVRYMILAAVISVIIAFYSTTIFVYNSAVILDKLLKHFERKS